MLEENIIRTYSNPQNVVSPILESIQGYAPFNVTHNTLFCLLSL